jgi:hypothetical protein
METTFKTTLEQKKGALFYLLELAEEEINIASHLKEQSGYELTLALNYIIDCVIYDIREELKQNAK